MKLTGYCRVIMAVVAIAATSPDARSAKPFRHRHQIHTFLTPPPPPALGDLTSDPIAGDSSRLNINTQHISQAMSPLHLFHSRSHSQVSANSPMSSSPSPDDIAARRARFRQLHQSGCFLIPNPPSAGAAVYLSTLGFQALASTSSGYAWSQGKEDNALSLEQTLHHLRSLVTSTDLPINADFVDGFGSTPVEVENAVSHAIDTGVAGISIEDTYSTWEGPEKGRQRPIKEAAERVRAAKRAIEESGYDVLLVGRAENFFVGNPDINDTIERLKAYSAAGADCLYAPGITDPDHIRAVVEAVAPKPVNILVGGPSQLNLDEIAKLGVRRVSVGGALARVAWGAVMDASERLARGDFTGLTGVSGDKLNDIMRR